MWQVEIMGQELAHLLAPFSKVSRGLYQRAIEWRSAAGGKVIGCVPMYVPEEIVHAAGILPITLLGGDETITLADKYVQPFMSCGVVRSTLDQGLKGKLSFLDGAIFPEISEPPERVADVWRRHVPLPFHHNFMLPILLDSPHCRQYLLEECELLKSALEQIGEAITEAALRRSITIYNENRRLLARLYEFRRQPGFPLKASEVADVVLAGMLMPKEEHSQLLRMLLPALEASAGKSDVREMGRIVLSGYTCDRPERYVLDYVESLGARFVDDDLYVGRRYFHGLAPETLPPLEALVERHLAGLPCITKHAEIGWSDYVVEWAREVNADGVLVMPLKYCDPLAFEYPYLKGRLEEAGIPLLWQEIEERGSGTGQVRTRLQAFVELVLARKETN